MPFADASQVLAELAHVSVAPTTVWEQVQRHGQRLQAVLERQCLQVGIERTRWEAGRYEARLYRSISLDGGMVHLRGEGWKEMKVGMVSGLEPCGQGVRLVDMDYTAVIGDVDAFRPALWSLAVQHDVPYAGRSAVTADGASWIWRLAQDLFPCSVQIVDWYHARQHLAQAARARYPDDEIAAKHWFERRSACLFRGEVWKIIADLCQHEGAALASYFVTHQRRMQYAQFRADGYPIGSGGVESGIKQFKHRLTGAGMRWSRGGAHVGYSGGSDDPFDGHPLGPSRLNLPPISNTPLETGAFGNGGEMS
jgi:hypothetical protein